MHYEVIVSNQGVPFQTWQVDADEPITPADAINKCRRQRVEAGEHSDADRYDAVPALDMSDDEALDVARLLARLTRGVQ